MSKIDISPMLVQYLVGLCCLRWHPDAVDIVVGDMVLDIAAGKTRDIDVTVTVSEGSDITHAFKAYEVKHRGGPLDVAEVEQLCIKFLDMPKLTYKAIVSTSGFTSSAQMKAANHGVILYKLHPWTRPLQEQFPDLKFEGTAEECFPTRQLLLCWTNQQLALVAQAAKVPFTVKSDDVLYNSSEIKHAKYKDFAEYQDEILLRSTETLFNLEPATSVLRTFPVPLAASSDTPSAGPAWPHTHTLDVRADDVCVQTGQSRSRIDLITISGQLQWQSVTENTNYYIMEQIPSGEAFAGALVCLEKRQGNMTALVFSTKIREFTIHFVRLEEKHLNCIRELQIDRPDMQL